MALALALAAGCERPPAVPVADSTAGGPRPPVASPVDAPAAAASPWERAAGPLILLPTVDGGVLSGSLIRPEANDSTVADTTGLGATLGDARLELFARSGPVGSARMAVEVPRMEPGACTAWPVGRLTPDAGTTPGAWTAGFAAGRVEAVPLDSIEGLAPRDSAQLAARLSRLASALPDDTSATFRGRPFVVLRAWRSREDPAPGVPPFVVAMLVRRVAQEDNPLEERLVLVVDLPGNDLARAAVGWTERAAGREDELVVAEPLVAYRLREGGDGVRLLFARDDGLTLSAAVLARDASGWHVRWQSAVAGCPT